jgi:cysteine desulfurase/selenocysteine lyase
MDPFMTGGGMNAKFDMCGDVGYLEPPLRFEAGTQNIEGILGLNAAIDYIMGIGIDNINAYEEELKKYAVAELEKTNNVIIYNAKSEAGIVTFNIKNVFAQDAATYLNSARHRLPERPTLRQNSHRLFGGGCDRPRVLLFLYDKRRYRRLG